MPSVTTAVVAVTDRACVRKRRCNLFASSDAFYQDFMVALSTEGDYILSNSVDLCKYTVHQYYIS